MMPTSKTKECPFCGEEILESAKKCRFCGEFLNKEKEEKSEEKINETKPKSTVGNFIGQLALFLFGSILFGLAFSTFTFFGVLLTVCGCFWYCYVSKDDSNFFGFKEIFSKERLLNKKRMIPAIILVVLFGFLTSGMYASTQNEEKAKANAPEVVVTMLTEGGDVGDNQKFTVKAKIEGGDTATINGQEVEIKDGIVEKEIDLDIPQKGITVVGKNKYKSGTGQIVVTRNENEKEKADREERERIEAEKKAEQDKLAKEKESKINALKAKCRVTKDDFEKITWYATKSLKEGNNQNSIDLYIGVDDNGDILPRLRIRYYGDDWLFVNNYQFLFGENVLTYTPGKVERDNAGGMVWEWSDTFVGADEWKIINGITSYDNPTIRYNGSKYRDDREITQKEVNALKDMKELYLLLTDQLI